MFNPLDYRLCYETPRYLSGTSAWERHIPFAFALTQMLDPNVLVELGTHKGDSYLAFCQSVEILNCNTKCFAVDHWEGDEHSGEYQASVYKTLAAYHEPLYGKFSNLLKCKFDEALLQFRDGTIDLLHIDGLHTYEAVKHDFEVWLPKMSTRSVILFHDTDVHEREFGVWKLWDDLKSRYPSFEFKHGYGLGVLGVGSELPEPIGGLLECDGEQVTVVRDFFSHLGDLVALKSLLPDYEELKHAYNKQAQAQAAEMRVELKELTERCVHLEQMNAEIMKSLSWRFTAPARAMTLHLKKLRNRDS